MNFFYKQGGNDSFTISDLSLKKIINLTSSIEESGYYDHMEGLQSYKFSGVVGRLPSYESSFLSIINNTDTIPNEIFGIEDFIQKKTNRFCYTELSRTT